jgi:pyruvate,water dikinase
MGVSPIDTMPADIILFKVERKTALRTAGFAAMRELIERARSIWGSFRKGRETCLPFKSAFAYFKKTLASNDRALEAIMDMAEKLGGDYIFDINYILNTHSAIEADIHRSIEAFNILTCNRYAELRSVFDRINDQITGVLSDSVSMASTPRVLLHEDINWSMANDVGGKNAHLAELKRHMGVKVPPAFAITTKAFAEFVLHNGLDQEIRSLDLNHGRSLSNPATGNASNGEGDSKSALEGMKSAIMRADIPPALDRDIGEAVERIKTECGENCFVAVRSSAEEEDNDFSFAGQYDTVLNVPLEVSKIEEAYKQVIASLFSAKALAYQAKMGYEPSRARMGAVCMAMVDAVASGVIYSTDANGDKDDLVISATWGLGSSIVEGQIDADLYVLEKGEAPQIIHRRCGAKDFMITCLGSGGTTRVETPGEMRERFCLTEEQARLLALQAIRIEKYFKRPQDIEWALDRRGEVSILQSRPLRIARRGTLSVRGLQEEQKGEKSLSQIQTESSGIVVQKGVGVGKVFILRSLDDLNAVPRAAIVVSKHDSSHLVQVMPYISAIITDLGAPTSHMASLCREFRIPTVVNMGNATDVFRQGQEITVIAGDEGKGTIYEGAIPLPRELETANGVRVENLFEFRRKRYILRYISSLNLIDPFVDDFAPAGCRTMHDIIRFIHERSVEQLVQNAERSSVTREHSPVTVDLPIPVRIVVIDIGGALSSDAGKKKVRFDQIMSVPLRAIIKGMLTSGSQRSVSKVFGLGDILSSMTRFGEIPSGNDSLTVYNVAVASGDYVNFSLRLGYHFSVLDCYCSENARNNHIYFRFLGGAASIVKRRRRVQFIATVLQEHGFNINTTGDLIVARLTNLRRNEIEVVLDKMGKLLLYTRQLDSSFRDDSAVKRYAKDFRQRLACSRLNPPKDVP